jgi:signal transduction histidine kinase
MDDLLNIDEIKLIDILRQLDFKASILSLNKEYNLNIEIFDNEDNSLFKTDNSPEKIDENKIKLSLSKRRLGLLYFDSSHKKDFFRDYLELYFKEQIKLGYKIYLTNEIHLKLAEESYNELEQKNQELVKANIALKELDKIKTNFLAMISHELKTPLTSIIGYTEFLQLEDLTPESEETVEKILNNSLELYDLIKQILDITKIEEGALTVNKKIVDLNKLIEDITEAVSYLLKNKDITLEKEISLSQYEISIDEEKIFQSIRNLLTNAIKFSKKQSKIILKLEQISKIVEDDDPSSESFTFFGAEEEEFLKISVIDNGTGISKEHQDKLFNSFYQVDGTQTRSHGGTGLGLSIVKNFILAHHGNYGVESEVNQGSTFWLELPYS